MFLNVDEPAAGFTVMILAALAMGAVTVATMPASVPAATSSEMALEASPSTPTRPRPRRPDTRTPPPPAERLYGPMPSPDREPRPASRDRHRRESESSGRCTPQRRRYAVLGKRDPGGPRRSFLESLSLWGTRGCTA